MKTAGLSPPFVFCAGSRVVIASEAKQSIALQAESGLLRRYRSSQ
jgi:hypothetical protein